MAQSRQAQLERDPVSFDERLRQSMDRLPRNAHMCQPAHPAHEILATVAMVLRGVFVLVLRHQVLQKVVFVDHGPTFQAFVHGFFRQPLVIHEHLRSMLLEGFVVVDGVARALQHHVHVGHGLAEAMPELRFKRVVEVLVRQHNASFQQSPGLRSFDRPQARVVSEWRLRVLNDLLPAKAGQLRFDVAFLVNAGNPQPDLVEMSLSIALAHVQDDREQCVGNDMQCHPQVEHMHIVKHQESQRWQGWSKP